MHRQHNRPPTKGNRSTESILTQRSASLFCPACRQTVSKKQALFNKGQARCPGCGAMLEQRNDTQGDATANGLA